MEIDLYLWNELHWSTTFFNNIMGYIFAQKSYKTFCVSLFLSDERNQDARNTDTNSKSSIIFGIY